MLAALIAVSAVLLLCIITVAVLVSRASSATPADAVEQDPAWFQRVLKKRIVVHTLDDQSIQGTLMEHTLDGVILRAAELLQQSGQPTKMAGETFIPREKIAFAQLDE